MSFAPARICTDAVRAPKLTEWSQSGMWMAVMEADHSVAVTD